MAEHKDSYLVAVCYEPQMPIKKWAFYFINNTDAPIEALILKRVEYEWGDMGSVTAVNESLGALPERSFHLAWRDDEDEMRIEMIFQARTSRGEEQLNFELPMLYKRIEDKAVPILGKCRCCTGPTFSSSA